MEGLIPIVKGIKPGLSQYHLYRNWYSNAKIRISFMSPEKVFNAYICKLYGIQNGRSGEITFAINGYKDAKQEMKITFGTLPFCTIYYKEGASVEFLLEFATNCSGIIDIITNSPEENAGLLLESFQGTAEGWTKIIG